MLPTSCVSQDVALGALRDRVQRRRGKVPKMTKLYPPFAIWISTPTSCGFLCHTLQECLLGWAVLAAGATRAQDPVDSRSVLRRPEAMLAINLKELHIRRQTESGCIEISLLVETVLSLHSRHIQIFVPKPKALGCSRSMLIDRLTAGGPRDRPSHIYIYTSLHAFQPLILLISDEADPEPQRKLGANKHDKLTGTTSGTIPTPCFLFAVSPQEITVHHL